MFRVHLASFSGSSSSVRALRTASQRCSERWRINLSFGTSLASSPSASHRLSRKLLVDCSRLLVALCTL